MLRGWSTNQKLKLLDKFSCKEAVKLQYIYIRLYEHHIYDAHLIPILLGSTWKKENIFEEKSEYVCMYIYDLYTFLLFTI